ncbi:MAG: lycopene beta-cyclase CrtY [Polyangiaceae bacterium]|nr:lycopene beta-cyclase CrtY [Polyangiaceae bacterium]
MAGENHWDYVLVGGGLQNCLMALALLSARPATKLLMLERDASLGGNHIWCFHAGDVSLEARGFIDPLVVRRWPGYDVFFPHRERRLDESYAAVTSERLDQIVRERIGAASRAQLLTQAEVTSVGRDWVRLSDGSEHRARLVIDARGPEQLPLHGVVGYQKFLGLELRLRRPAARDCPVIMDARVPQTDGFRFFYWLPFEPDRVLLEDTYFSDGPELDLTNLRQGILDYARRAGLDVAEVEREERGVLPLPTRHVPVPSAESPLVGGYQGGWFHPTTGYSFPLALRLAQVVARTMPDRLFGPDWTRLVARHRAGLRYALLLNRMLFGAFLPEDRYHVMERFYGLPAATIRRFYALTLTRADRVRILCGRVPRGFSLRQALASRTFP